MKEDEKLPHPRTTSHRRADLELHFLSSRTPSPVYTALIVAHSCDLMVWLSAKDKTHVAMSQPELESALRSSSCIVKKKSQCSVAKNSPGAQRTGLRLVCKEKTGSSLINNKIDRKISQSRVKIGSCLTMSSREDCCVSMGFSSIPYLNGLAFDSLDVATTLSFEIRFLSSTTTH